MPLLIEKLEKVQNWALGKVRARCPACAEAGMDDKGQHLVVLPDGRFGCAVNPGPDGQAHRKRIWALAGDGTLPEDSKMSILQRLKADPGSAPDMVRRVEPKAQPVLDSKTETAAQPEPVPVLDPQPARPVYHVDETY